MYTYTCMYTHAHINPYTTSFPYTTSIHTLQVFSTQHPSIQYKCPTKHPTPCSYALLCLIQLLLQSQISSAQVMNGIVTLYQLQLEAFSHCLAMRVFIGMLLQCADALCVWGGGYVYVCVCVRVYVCVCVCALRKVLMKEAAHNSSNITAAHNSSAYHVHCMCT